MIPYTILPPSGWPDGVERPGEPDTLPDESEELDEKHCLPAEQRMVDVCLGSHAGVPVRVLARWEGCTLRVVRLLTTDPDLYLEPRLAPGAPLPWVGLLRGRPVTW